MEKENRGRSILEGACKRYVGDDYTKPFYLTAKVSKITFTYNLTY
jgi:hypothetical protein